MYYDSRIKAAPVDINRSKSFDMKLCSVLSELTVGRDKACLVSTARTYGMTSWLRSFE